MATVTTDADMLTEWMEDKQANEQEMLNKLNRAYDRPVPRNKMRAVCEAAFQRMSEELSSAQRATVIGALTAEKDLSVWENVPASTPADRVEQMLEKLGPQGPLDCNDLSELIRVIGAWLERGGGHGGLDLHERNKDQKHYTEGILGENEPTITGAYRVGPYWAKATVRQRAGKPLKKSFDIPRHVQKFWIPPKKEGAHSGMEFFRVNGSDLCRKIDLFFGLLKGATISGTTTDTVLVMEAFGYGVGIHAGYYLFPVATIAASLHHTLLEAGLALGFVGAIDGYSVGFYSTLKPKGGFPGELDSVRGTLHEYEGKPKNRHMTLWYDMAVGEHTPVGGILWDPREARIAKNSLLNGKNLLDKMMPFPNLPNKDNVVRLIKELSPELLTLKLKRDLYDA